MKATEKAGHSDSATARGALMDKANFGSLSGHAAGIIMKELVRRAVAAIRTEMLTFDVVAKMGYDGQPGDIVTSADHRAQQIYLRSLRECFPTFGIIAEEDHLRVACTDPHLDAWFAIDPVDGTRALVRRQSHGIGTMLALVVDGVVVSAWIGDVMTGEIYGYRPGSEKVHRIRDLDIAERLVFDHATPFNARNILLHDPLSKYTHRVRSLVERPGVAHGYDVMGGSVGIWTARLWKGEVGLAALPAAFETPWDSAPVIGISQKLGFVFIEVPERTAPRVIDLKVPVAPTRREHDMLIVHAQHADHVLDRLYEAS